MNRYAHRLTSLLCLLLLACANPEATPPIADGAPADLGGADGGGPDGGVTTSEPKHVLLTHNAAWVLESSVTDPYPLREGGVRCDDSAVVVEEIDQGLWLDIVTDSCDHASLQQTTLDELGPGDVLLVWIWHYAMEHEGGEFHAQVSIGAPGQVAWETQLPVPAVSGLIYDEVVVSDGWPAGSPIWFHLSNHGANTWSLIEVARLDPP